jgi:hypothetical protein
MIRPIPVLLIAVSAVACSREAPPAQPPAPVGATTPMQTALVTTTAENEPVAPGAPAIPASSPEVASPTAPAAKPPEDVPLTPANGVAAPRSSGAAFVQSAPGIDKAQSPADQDSVREIRDLIAADKSLSATSRQITVVAKQGRVWLRGQVTTAEDRAALERLARQAGGVIDVKNELAVME